MSYKGIFILDNLLDKIEYVYYFLHKIWILINLNFQSLKKIK